MWHLHDTAVFEDVIISFSQQYAQFLLIGSGYGGRLKKESRHPSTQPQPPALFNSQVFKGHMNSRGSLPVPAALQGGVQETSPDVPCVCKSDLRHSARETHFSCDLILSANTP